MNLKKVFYRKQSTDFSRWTAERWGVSDQRSPLIGGRPKWWQGVITGLALPPSFLFLRPSDLHAMPPRVSWPRGSCASVLLAASISPVGGGRLMLIWWPGLLPLIGLSSIAFVPLQYLSFSWLMGRMPSDAWAGRRSLTWRCGRDMTQSLRFQWFFFWMKGFSIRKKSLICTFARIIFNIQRWWWWWTRREGRLQFFISTRHQGFYRNSSRRAFTLLSCLTVTDGTAFFSPLQ